MSLEVTIRRDDKVCQMGFKDGVTAARLRQIDWCGPRNTGAAVKFTPDLKYFDSINLSVSRLKHILLLRAKVVLCPKLRVKFKDEAKGGRVAGMGITKMVSATILQSAILDFPVLPEPPFVGSFSGSSEGVD